jgi:ADP-ribose pyrophosphatase YjhB (NUDIX family)
VIERVRAILVTPARHLLTIRRSRPGTADYWVLPGGHVEPADTTREAALHREVREELCADIRIHGLLHVLESPGERQLFYLAHVDRWSSSDRTGPEFTDPTRGGYDPQTVPLTVDGLVTIDLKPDPLADLLLSHLRQGIDLFTLPDLRVNERSSDAQPAT